MPFPLIGSLASRGVVAPCYHLVSDDPPPHVRHLYRCRTIAEFAAELDLLLRRFKPLSLSELVRAIRDNGRAPDGSLFLSFDDGVAEVSEPIAGVCHAKGVPATFFLTSGFLDNRMLFFRHKASILAERCAALGRERSFGILQRLDAWHGAGDPGEFLLSLKYQQTAVLDQCAALLEVDFEAYLRSAKPYLTGEQVNGVLKRGFEIGGHSVDHPLYADLSLEDQLAQTRLCMAELRGRFQTPVQGFAFPFVSDGVGPEFYQTILGENTADLIFCLGGEPAVRSPRLVQRFGVEERNSRSLQVLLRAEASRKSLARVRALWRRSAFPVEQRCEKD